jgi:hypothetical protein
MSELATVFVLLAGVIVGLALMGALIWTAQRDGFRATETFAPLRSTPQGRRTRAAGRPAPRTRPLRPAYEPRR